MHCLQKQQIYNIERNALLAIMVAAYMNFNMKCNFECNGSDVLLIPL